MICDVRQCGYGTLSSLEEERNGGHECGRQDMMILTLSVLLRMLRTLTTTLHLCIQQTAEPHFCIYTFHQKLAHSDTRRAHQSCPDYTSIAADPKEGHAAVLIPLCNVNDQPGILLELRGKLRTHSGEVRYGLSC
jgi:hypothetical protein